MDNSSKPRIYNPLFQVLILIFSIFIISCAFYCLVSFNLFDPYPKFYWMSATAFLLLYALFNSVISLAVDGIEYWGRSVTMFLLLAAIGGGIAYLFSGISVYDAGSYSFIYGVVTFGYLVFISIMGFVKKIVLFAQKEVWLQPKLRKRK